jgi:signal transduction histidine kinase
MEGIEVQLDWPGTPLVGPMRGRCIRCSPTSFSTPSGDDSTPHRKGLLNLPLLKDFPSYRFVKIRTNPSPSFLSAGPFIRVVIRDTGSGLPLKTWTKSSTLSTKGTGEGTGLGLYIVSGILKNYGAEYHLESTVGQGTTFTVDFPLSNIPRL